jgi:tetratricopeptide (TPR) repeat protein
VSDRVNRGRRAFVIVGIVLIGLALLFVRCYPQVALNLGNLLFSQKVLGHKPGGLVQAQRVLAQAEARAETAEQARWTQFRLCLFVQDWICARRYLPQIDLTELDRETIGVLLANSPRLVETVARDDIPPGLIQLLQDVFTSPQSYFKMGNIYEAAGRPVDAINMYTLAINNDQNGSLTSAAYLSMGILSVKQAKWEEAVTFLQKAVESNPTNRVQAYGWMMRPLVELGRRQEAISYVQQLLADADSSFWKHVHLMTLGYLYGRQDCSPCDFDKAYQYFQQARNAAVSQEQRVEAEQWMRLAANRQDH